MCYQSAAFYIVPSLSQGYRARFLLVASMALLASNGSARHQLVKSLEIQARIVGAPSDEPVAKQRLVVTIGIHGKVTLRLLGLALGLGGFDGMVPGTC